MKPKKSLMVPMMMLELVLLAANWLVAVISPRLGKKFMEWNLRTMPDKDWYL